jgi:transcription-repair coupling factor (superfamily II helicase)
MKEFGNAFEFIETEDQAQAISACEGDMESGAMDRLLCWRRQLQLKVEVAMPRFPAISDNKQVAVLAPTRSGVQHPRRLSNASPPSR